jgi:hypothetical protein
MTTFTVEAVTKPVGDEAGWSQLRRVTDMVPGTLLIEDADEPTLVLPVTASSPGRAALFVEGVLNVVGVEFISGTIERVEDDGPPPHLPPEAEREHEWVESIPTHA